MKKISTRSLSQFFSITDPGSLELPTGTSCLSMRPGKPCCKALSQTPRTLPNCELNSSCWAYGRIVIGPLLLYLSSEGRLSDQGSAGVVIQTRCIVVVRPPHAAPQGNVA